jgi:hypothetical protein
MATAPDKGHDLIDALIKGGEKAVRNFSSISGGEWFDEAPEYFLTTYVASELKNFEKTTALLEVSVSQCQKEAEATRRGRPAKAERRNGRYDVVAYWANGFPRGAIEVKSPIWVNDQTRLMPDFTRLCLTLNANQNGTFQFCAFVFYASVSNPKQEYDNASQRLRDLVSRIEETALEVAKENGVRRTMRSGSIRRGKNDDDGAWCIGCVIFSNKGGENSFRNPK